MEGGASGYLQIQAKRISTGSILALQTKSITVTWDALFKDANYTLSASVQTSGLSVLQVDSIVSLAADSCVLAVKNISLSSNSGTIHILAVHDL